MDLAPLTRRSLLRTGVGVGVGAGVGAAAAGLAGPAAAAGPTVERTVVSGLDHPWGLDFLPDGTALVTERDTGKVKRINPGDGAVVRTDEVPGVFHVGEGGLLGLAVSPDFESDKRVFLYHSTAKDNRVVSAIYGVDGFGDWKEVVTGIPRGTIHHGGALAWSSNGRLHIGCGESGKPALAPDKFSLGGKILRVTPDGKPTLTTTNRDPRILSWGHRNPEGIAFNVAGEVWAAELGWNTWDELNQILPGRNYGWPRSEGTDGSGGYQDPLVQWNPRNCSPSGLAIIDKKAYLGALRGQSLWVVDIHGIARRTKQRYFAGTYGRLRNVKATPTGKLWVTTDNGNGTDKILEVSPA